MKKRILLFVGAAAFALVAGLLATWLYIGRSGTTELENWLGRQIAGILQNHITPAVHFDNIDYQAPRTVIVENLALTAEGRPIVHIGWARLELAEIPQRGKPIKIQHIDLSTPRFQFITTGTGDLIGWSNFIKKQAITNPESVPEGQRLSDVLVLRHVGIKEGEIVYEGESDGRERMTLPGINLRLDTPADENNPGWHVLAGHLKRDPLVDLQLNGRINLDTGLLEIAKLQLAASLSEAQYSTLPPALQNFLRRHEVQGAFNLLANGRLPLKNPAEFAGKVSTTLKDARVRYGGTVMPVKDLAVNADLPRGGIDVAVNGVNLAGEDQSFFSVQSITARLAGIPAKNEPLVIERVHVSQPHVVFASRSGGGLKGWSQMADVAKKIDQKPDEPKEESEDHSSALQAIRLNEFKIQGGSVTYKPVHDDAMTIDGIEVVLASTPRDQSPDVLDVTGSAQAGPLIKADLRGELNTVTAALTLAQFQAGLDVTSAVYDQLPPLAREWARRHQFQGKVVASGQAQIPLHEPSATQLEAKAELTSAQLLRNGVTIPLNEARAQIKLPERHIEASVAGVQLVADDRPFFTLRQLSARLSMPADGPMVLDELVIDQPAATFVSNPAGGFVGWDRLTGKSTASTQPAPSASRGSTPMPMIRSVRIQGGSVGYASDPAQKPVHIKSIDVAVTAPEQNANLLDVTGKISDAVVQAQLAGKLNRDERVLQVEQLQANTTISEDRYADLPPAVHNLLTPYRFRGKLALTASGTVPLDDTSKTQGQVQAEMISGSLRYKGLDVPIGQASVQATLPDGPLSINVADLAIDAGKTPLAKAKSIAVKTRALPWRSESVQIELIRMEQPAVNLVQQPQGGFVGWSQLSQPAANGNAQASPASGKKSNALDRFHINRIEFAGAELRYEGPDTNGPIIVQGLEANLQTQKAKDANALAFAGQVRQPDILMIDLEGRYDASRSTLSFSKCIAKARVDDASLARLPQATRESFAGNQVQGNIEASWQGTVPLGGAGELKGRLEVNASDARLRFADALWPVGRLNLQADLPAGPVNVVAERFAARTGDLDFFSAAALELQIDELGNEGKPTRIARLAMKSPRAVLLSRNGGFAGWDTLTADKGKPKGEEKKAIEPATIVNKIEVREGEFIYAPAPGQQAMSLPGIDLVASLEPASKSNWYSVVGRIKRGPLLDMDLRGRFNAAAQLLDLESCRLHAEVNEGQIKALPPPVQAFLTDHEVRGVFSIEAKGRIPFKDPEQLQGLMTATARNAHFSYDQTQWPIQQLDIRAEANKGVISAQASADMLGGKLQADARASLPQGGAFDLNWQISQMRLEKMLRAVQDEQSRYEGVLTSKGQVKGRLGALPQTLSGAGELAISEGRLLHLPIIEHVVVNALTAALLGREREPHDDKAQATWTFRPDALAISKMTLVSRLIGLDGRGDVFYDGRLDLRLNAEPRQIPRVLPKGLPGGIDRVGNLLQDVGTLTGKIVTYRVDGTMAEPRVTPVPLGLSGK